MQFKKSFILLVFISLLVSCKKNYPEPYAPQIIPIPKEQVIHEGVFILNSKTGIIDTAGFNVASTFLKEIIERGSEINLQENDAITFIKDDNITNPEGYLLDISSEKISIKAKTDSGAFYAVQTLRQLLPAGFENGSFNESEVALQSLKIQDAPQFKYRGMHLDVGRHMYSPDFIKKYIDALAMLKMNTFHWHLTEDQGWRIEIKKYPKLQEVAAFRKETLNGHYSDQPHQFDGNSYGGFYSQNDIKDIVAYAQTRAITIIPEIEMPGHSQAAIAAYPELGCTGEQVEVATKWGVFEEVYCTKNETFEFLENVLDEVMALFPSEYIHIGGDEAPKTHWKSCPDCQQKIKDESLLDEHELQNYFITRIEKYLNSKGRQIIGWDEILEGGLAPNATVMSWRGINGAVEAAKQEHNVVMTPTSHCYFDYYQSENDEEPLAIGGYLPLEKVYGFNPIPEDLSKEESKYVLGAQGNIWTEYMPTETQVEYMAFPRILAMSEVVWSNVNQKDYSDFVGRVEHFNKRLDALGINYANHLNEVQGELISKEGLSFQLKTLTREKQIRYTLDGSEPSFASELYIEPIIVNNSIKINAAVFTNKEKLGNTFSETINLHKAVGNKISINVKPHKSYSGSGANGLVNGISGSDSRFGDKEWLGFWGDDIVITIDLGKETEIDSIKTRFHNGQGQWIYAPRQIEIEFDNETETLNTPDSNDILVDVSLKKKQKTRFIKLIVPNFGMIPEGKQGSGNKAWTFIDEIIIN